MAEPKGSRKRDETFWKILNAALELDFKKGYLKWTMSELSRKSGITRSLIYYHFGRSKISILEEAVRVIGEEFIGTSPTRLELWKQGDIAGSLKSARQIYRNSPFLCQFYLNHRERPTEVGESLRKLETSYLKKLKTFFPRANETDIHTLFAIVFGVTFAPFVEDAVIDRIAMTIRTVTATL